MFYRKAVILFFVFGMLIAKEGDPCGPGCKKDKDGKCVCEGDK